MTEKDKVRNQASALEGRIRARLESAEASRNHKMHELKIDGILIPFLAKNLKPSLISSLVKHLNNANVKQEIYRDEMSDMGQ